MDLFLQRSKTNTLSPPTTSMTREREIAFQEYTMIQIKSTTSNLKDLISWGATYFVWYSVLDFFLKVACALHVQLPLSIGTLRHILFVLIDTRYFYGIIEVFFNVGCLIVLGLSYLLSCVIAAVQK